MLRRIGGGLAQRVHESTVVLDEARWRVTHDSVEVAGALLPDLGRDRAGFEQRDFDAPRPQLAAQRVAERLHRVLRYRIGPERRCGEEPCDRAGGQDAAASPAQQRQERLRHGDLADHVHLELAPEVVDRQALERATHRDARVIEEAPETGVPDGRRDAGDGGADLFRVRHVEFERLEPSVSCPPEPPERGPPRRARCEPRQRRESPRRAAQGQTPCRCPSMPR